MNQRANIVVILILTVIISGLSSCTEAYKKKQETANELLDEMRAGGVIVGYSAKAEAGSESTKTTTLTFSDVEMGDPIELEFRVNRVAMDFFAKVGETEMKDETHLEVIVQTKDDASYSFLFPLSDLRKMESYLAVADAMVNACHEMDTTKIQELKDDAYLPEEVMAEIYAVNAYNDSIYRGQPFAIEQTGYRIANGEDDPDLELLSVDYECGNDMNKTRYTINVDRKTKKVVYMWMKTDPR